MVPQDVEGTTRLGLRMQTLELALSEIISQGSIRMN